MKVRDLTLPKTDYKGHVFDASGSFCPCRPCLNAHDCGSVYGGSYHEDFQCAYRYNNGCPFPKPEAVHILNRLGRCKRCGCFPNKLPETTWP